MTKHVEDHTPPKEKTGNTASPQKISSQQRHRAFSTTLTQARTHMNPVSSAFSKIIHVRLIEITSGLIGSTIARPNAILFGALSSLTATFTLYLAAKYYGYPLSGSESIAAFILGWAIGLIIDYTRILIYGRRP